MVDRPAWTITLSEAEQPLPPGGEWGEVARRAAASERGSITARRAGSAEEVTLRFNGGFALLEHWASEEGPVWAARFPNRPPVAVGRVELPCCGCGIPLEVPDGYVLRKEDALRLFLQFLDSGEPPGELAEPPRAAVQLLLPGMEEFLLPPAVVNAVRWEPL